MILQFGASSNNFSMILEALDVVYVPPDVDALTDEEDIDDENTSPAGPEPLDAVGNFELYVPSPSESKHEPVRLYEWDSSDEETLEAKRKKMSASTSRDYFRAPKWVEGPIEYTHFPISNEHQAKSDMQNQLAGKTPLEIFHLFFDDDVVDLVLGFSHKYAADNNRHDFTLSKEELLNFIGIVFLTGYHTLPQISMYWSTDEDKGVDIVKKCMSRNRFYCIKQNLHLSDNDILDKNDKFAKIRPFIDIINKKNLQWGIFSFALSIDEQMVPYFGRHSCKMFIKGKPVRFGFKLWCLCSSDGYLFYTLPYAGAQNKNHSELGLGGDVVNNLLSVVKEPFRHKIYFDNYFSSFRLFVHLKNEGFFATGTIRENRTNKCPLENCKKFTKKQRGAFASAYDDETKVSIVRWNDNSTVTVCSNIHNVTPVNKVKRYNRKERKDIYISQPNVISEYNKYMGGVDLHDNGIANYRSRVLGKKWWWPLFCNSLDSIIVNAWKLYNILNETKMSQLDFKSYVALRLVKTEKIQVVRNISHPIDEIRFDKSGHSIIFHETKARRRCRVCHKHTMYICQRCNVHLHVNCFASYHEKV